MRDLLVTDEPRILVHSGRGILSVTSNSRAWIDWGPRGELIATVVPSVKVKGKLKV